MARTGGGVRTYFPAAGLVGRVAAKDTAAHNHATIGLDAEADVAYVPNAIDLRALDVTGNSAWPLAAPGQVILFDAGRPIDPKDPAFDGKLVVAEVDGEVIVKRRHTSGKMRIYNPINGGAEHAPIIIPIAKVRNEYPVVAVLLDPKRIEP